MKPEFPHEFNTSYRFVGGVEPPLDCEMLRFERPCTNASNHVIWFTDEYDRPGKVAICDQCLDELGMRIVNGRIR